MNQARKKGQEPSTKKQKSLREGYLSHALFKIGPPNQNGNSEGVLVVYLNDGSRLDFYSKDCKHLYDKPKRWSFQDYGLPYLRNIWLNGGDETIKFNKANVNSVVIYPAVFKANQEPIETLFKAVITLKKSVFQLPIYKQLEYQKSANDKCDFIFSTDYFLPCGKLDLKKTIDSVYVKYKAWEEKNKDKRIKGSPLRVYVLETKEPYAEMSATTCAFFDIKTKKQYAF